MKLFVALGPGDIVAAHRAQMNGEAIVSETSITFSGQLLEYCRERGIETLALSHNGRVDDLRDGPLRVENRPRRFPRRGKVGYHVSSVLYGIYLALRARLFGADLAVVDSGSAHYFALTSFRLLRIPVAVNFHNTLWPNGFEPKGRLARILRSFDGWFFRHIAVGAIGVSPECADQVRQLARRPLPFFEYRSQFRSDGFLARRSDETRNPFRVVFVGRIERDKGALDVLKMAVRLRDPWRKGD
jgi:glycosyltransferase involved in cell wall biosynthesis